MKACLSFYKVPSSAPLTVDGHSELVARHIIVSLPFPQYLTFHWLRALRRMLFLTATLKYLACPSVFGIGLSRWLFWKDRGEGGST